MLLLLLLVLFDGIGKLGFSNWQIIKFVFIGSSYYSTIMHEQDSFDPKCTPT